MSVGIQVGSVVDEIGAASFFHSFFSTISVHCETRGWGSRFPALMRHLYQGHVTTQQAAQALAELRIAKEELSRLPPSKVVWDISDRTAQPPWGSNIAEDITSLATYFVSSTGRDLFALLEEALRAAVEEHTNATIV